MKPSVCVLSRKHRRAPHRLRALSASGFSVGLGIGLSVGLGLGLGTTGCGPASDVQGTAIFTKRPTLDSPVSTTEVWPGRTIQALATDGTYEIASGKVDEQGLFVIPKVPAGPYWLAFPDEYSSFVEGAKVFAWTEARALDLGFQQVSPPLSAFTDTRRLPLRLSGLSPAQDEDKMYVFTTGRRWIATWGILPLGTEQNVSPLSLSMPLRRNASEHIYASQQRTTVQNGVTWRFIVRAGSAPLPDDAADALEIAMSDASPQRLSFQVDHPGFLAQFANPQSPPLSFAMFIDADADPGGATSGSSERVLDGYLFKAADRDPSLSGVPYSDPYPAEWTRRYHLSYMTGLNYELPGAPSGDASCAYGIRVQGELRALSQGPVRPPLSLPQAFEIDQRSAHEPNERVNATPTVRWQPPASGQVSTYELIVNRLQRNDDGGTTAVRFATFLTPHTEIQLPREVLQPGTSYFLRLSAISSDADFAAAPRRATLRPPRGESSLCSAAFTVPGPS